MASDENFEIPVSIAGIRFRNPFYVASGPTTMTIEQLERIRDTGWGGASLKLTIDPKPYINRRPRYGYFPDMNFLSFTAEKRLTLDELLRLIEQGRRHTPELVLFSNITYAGDRGIEGWVDMARKCEAAGAHVNELNMCCPNMSFNVELSGGGTGGPQTGASLGQQKEALAEIVRAIKSETGIPLFVKITPEGGHIADVAAAAIEAGADAVGGTANRLGVPPLNLDDPTSSTYYLQKEIGMACLCGEWLSPLARRDVYEMRRKTGDDAVITGAGGVTRWEDAVSMMMSGADLVGICTATLVYGFGFMPEFIRGFKDYMSRKGYEHTRQFRGVIVPAITSAANLTIYPGHAQKKTHALDAPCTVACPNSVPAQGYVRAVAEKDYRKAYRLIMSRSPLQSICGRVCDHPCEDACSRALKDEPVMIREIKRFVIEKARAEGWEVEVPRRKAKHTEKVAVIGSGPAGLACAYDLARAGYAVTVFEKDDILGGMLAKALPSFRMPESELRREIKTVEKLGVKFRRGIDFGKDVTLGSLEEDGYAAVFIGTGAQRGVHLGISGEDRRGVFSALDFLQAAKRGRAPETGKKVVVIGGGFTAVDSARTAVRLGAEQVIIAYRRTREEMPASSEEVMEAEEEGVRVLYLVSPMEIVGNGRVEAVRLQPHALGDEDDSGRRGPENVAGAGDFLLETDSVIVAVSQEVEEIPGEGLERRRGKIFVTDEKTGETSRPGVFAGGDCVRGPSDVISAIADGKRAAAGIDRYLAGDNVFLEPLPEQVEADREAALARHGGEARAFRPRQHKTSPDVRKTTFADYIRALTEEEAVAEAGRCMACGCGAGCEICVDICKVFAWSIDSSGRTLIDEEACVACGMCIHRCPNDNIEMLQTGTENQV